MTDASDMASSSPSPPSAAGPSSSPPPPSTTHDAGACEYDPASPPTTAGTGRREYDPASPPYPYAATADEDLTPVSAVRMVNGRPLHGTTGPGSRARAYVNVFVTPHALDAMRALVNVRPPHPQPLRFLAEFILERARVYEGFEDQDDDNPATPGAAAALQPEPEQGIVLHLPPDAADAIEEEMWLAAEDPEARRARWALGPAAMTRGEVRGLMEALARFGR